MLASQLSYTIIYLHGFQSSSRSQKAQALETFIKNHNGLAHIDCCAPDLPFSPRQTLNRIQALVSEKQRPVLMGSSMGGFYAAWASQELACPAVLINPAVKAELLFEGLVGQTLENVYTGEKHAFIDDDLTLLKSISDAPLNHPERIYCFLETGDEVLDYRLSEKKYKLCQQKIIAGGDHCFQSFELCLPEMFNFYEQALVSFQK